MPDPWYPNAVRLPGANAGYRAGRIQNLTTAIAHFTVGRNSTGTCGRDFQILAARDGTIYQGAEVDAVNWGAGDPWNHNSVHVEVEYLPGFDDTIFTDAARASVAVLLAWLESEWGIPLEYYDGPRRESWKGVISHRSLIQTGDYHSDWWPQEDWGLMTAGPPPGPVPIDPSKEFDVFLMRGPTSAAIVTADEVYIVQPADFTVPHVAVDQAQWDYIINDVRAKFTQKYA